MILFGCSVGEPDAYIRYAQPGIRLAAEPDSEILAFAGMESTPRTYNLLLDTAGAGEGLEALVIVHPHAQIADPALCAKLREALRDPEVAIVGCAGAAGVRSIAWWEGSVSCGAVRYHYTEHGGGELPAFAWADPSPAPAEVDAVDGFLMALSPWAVRNLRFDEQLVLGHGFDVDLCFQARAAGRKVAVADLNVIEHRPVEIVSDPKLWVEAHIAVTRKWEGRIDGVGIAPTIGAKDCARRAEAEREAARAIAYFKQLGYEARVQALEEALEEATGTASWRLTAPLRRLNKWRRDRADDADPRRPLPGGAVSYRARDLERS
jgi:hypothetical protein